MYQTMDVNVKRAVFAAFALLTILCVLFLFSRIVLYIFAFLCFIGFAYLGYDLFLKKLVSK